jgi:hypothetical protein
MVASFAGIMAKGQALPTPTGPGTYIKLGVQLTAAHINYGERVLGGGSVYLDASLTARYGIEAAVGTLRPNQDEGVHTTTFLVGPRISAMTGHIRPYGKLLVGRGEMTYPFGYATGSYFAVAVGGGLDVRQHEGPLTFRVLDVEWQNWPGFSYGGAFRAVSISTGVSYRLFLGH